MIVTRRRPKRRSILPILLPLFAIAALAGALYWPPSHNIIVNGPLKPVWNVGSGIGSTLSRPFSFATQQQHIADQNREVRRLNSTLEADRKTQANKDARITALQTQVTQLQAAPKATVAPVVVPKPKTLAGAAGNPPADAAAGAPDNVKRTAAYWSSMDAEKAAAIAQRLPDDYVNAVFSQMPPDSVADIMNTLPPKVAARLTAAASAAAGH
jgi:flagellar motility protein MotE (MotC chaperone)